MTDYIDRQAAIDALYHVDEYNGRSIKSLRNLPSADVEPVKHGRWIKHEHGFWTFVNDRGERDGWLPDYECNLCGSRAWRYASNYCPNCGAKMDLEGEDHEQN